MKNYFQEFDLNPTINGGPAIVNNPLDPRAHHDFCFESDSQDIRLVQQTTGAVSPVRVLISFACGHQPLLGPPVPPPPPPGSLQFPVDGLLVLDPAFPMDDRRRKTWDCCHLRRFVKVWIDPMGPMPQPGQPVIVNIWASAKGCADKSDCYK